MLSPGPGPNVGLGLRRLTDPQEDHMLSEERGSYPEGMVGLQPWKAELTERDLGLVYPGCAKGKRLESARCVFRLLESFVPCWKKIVHEASAQFWALPALPLTRPPTLLAHFSWL